MVLPMRTVIYLKMRISRNVFDNSGYDVQLAGSTSLSVKSRGFCHVYLDRLRLPLYIVCKTPTSPTSESSKVPSHALKRSENAKQSQILTPLCLDLVFTSEQVVNFSQVIGAGEQIVDAARWLVVLLQVSFLAQVTHLCDSVSSVCG